LDFFMNPTLLDGAMGTELGRRGLRTLLPLWSAHALLKAPDLVRQIHAEYVDAGAEVITANTFRATQHTLAKTGMALQAEELTERAVQLAREAISSLQHGQSVRIAGSLAPLEDCYQPDLVPPRDVLQREHGHQAELLAATQVDMILVETQNNILEACIATEMALSHVRTVWVSFVPRDTRTLLSGEALREAVKAVAQLEPDAILINCCLPSVAQEAVKVIGEEWDGPRGVYPNFGIPEDESDSSFSEALSPTKFAQWGAELLEGGVQIIGGCCGTQPAHIAALFKTMRKTPLTI
jgi:S-methylmethionine-dependent homocysteine/selenocysteine methylase